MAESTEVVVVLSTGESKRVYLSPEVQHPHALYLTGYLNNNGTVGLPLMIRVGGIQASSHAVISESTAASSISGCATIVVAEHGKWHENKHWQKLGQFNNGHPLQSFTVEVVDSSTGVAYVPGVANDYSIVLRFLVTSENKHAKVPLLSYTDGRMYSFMG
jgi:hypothetical protein